MFLHRRSSAASCHPPETILRYRSRATRCGRLRPHQPRHGVIPPESIRRRRNALPALSAAWLEQHGGRRRRHRRRPFRRSQRHAGTDAAHVYGGLLATLTAWCEQNTDPYQGVPVGTIKRLIAGKGNADKPAVDRRHPRPRIQSRRRQRGRRARHPAVGDRDRRGRAMTRTRLPDRRAAETVMLEHSGTRFMVTIGFYPDGRPARCSPMAPKSGSDLDALLADACVVVSCLIQHGVEPRDLAASMGRLGNAEPASIIGAVVDLVAAASIAQHQSAAEASQ